MGNPVNMVDPAGRVVTVPDEAIADAAAAGYRVESPDEHAGRLAGEVREETYGGIGGKAAALSAGVLRGATLGLSDVALGAAGGAEDLSALKSVNPITSTIGEIGGGIAASVAAPGSVLARTPTGMLAGLATRGVESARAIGGVAGFAGQAAVTGLEAAAQNAGSYLGSVALGDRELTAEGLGGALGSGFALGAAGGAAVYGIERGSIAARNLFSKTMEGGEDAARSAAGHWDRKFTEITQANDETLATAEQQLAATAAARQEAELASQRAGQHVAEERVLAQQAVPPHPAASLPDGFAMPTSAGRAVDDVAGAPVLARNPEELAASIREAREAKVALDRTFDMERRVTAGEVPGEAGPFTPQGAKLAAQREIAREDVRTATGGFDFAPSTGKALRDVERGPNIAQAAPISTEPEIDPLMRALQGTKSQLDDGATIAQVGIGARARPLSPRQLTDEVDRLTEAAARATDIEAKQTLLRQRSAIEDQLAQQSPSTKALSDIDAVTQAMHRYEAAMADVADHLGDAAHPLTREMASGLRKAESDAERQMLDRAAQAIDDHSAGVGKLGEEGLKTSAQQAGGDVFGPAPMPPKERIAYAKARKGEADAVLSKARADETQARMGYKAAQAKSAETARAAKTIGLPSPSGAAGNAGTGQALNMGSVLELAGMAGIPGLPKPSDIPIIGPALGLYLKARALKVGAERLMGRVPATGNARVAALAATTKDKAACAVDKMLGLVERTAPAQRSIVATAGPKLLEAVRDRLYDDGRKPPEKSAGIQEHVAARAAEISALVANPSLIAQQVRREMRGVADPDMVNAAVQFRTAQIQYLDKVSPKAPPPSPFQTTPWRPDKAAATDFARKYAVAMDPVVALEQVEQRCLTPEAAEAFRAVYPRLFQQTQMRLLDRSTQIQTMPDRDTRTRMSILFGIPLDSSLEPATLSRIQGTFSVTRPANQSSQPAPPTSSIAGPTNLMAMYQTASDRRAATR